METAQKQAFLSGCLPSSTSHLPRTTFADNPLKGSPRELRRAGKSRVWVWNRASFVCIVANELVVLVGIWGTAHAHTSNSHFLSSGGPAPGGAPYCEQTTLFTPGRLVVGAVPQVPLCVCVCLAWEVRTKIQHTANARSKVSLST